MISDINLCILLWFIPLSVCLSLRVMLFLGVTTKPHLTPIILKLPIPFSVNTTTLNVGCWQFLAIRHGQNHLGSP
jgi:hypothetical protein